MLLNLVAHVCALFAILGSTFYSPPIAALLTVLLVVSALRRLANWDTRQLHVNEKDWSVDHQPQQFIPPLFVGSWFIVLRFSPAGYLVIGRDSLAEEEFRRLTVLLRSRASRMMAA